MKEKFSSAVLRFALFLLVLNCIMLFIVPAFTAEWYITAISIVLMLALTVIIKVFSAIREKKNIQKKEDADKTAISR